MLKAALHPHCSLQRHARHGLGLFASRLVRAGEVVVAEPPLLQAATAVDEAQPWASEVTAAAAQHGLHVGNLLQLAAFSEAPAAVRSRVLSLFTPDAALPGAARHLEVAEAAVAAVLSSGAPPFRACRAVDPAALRRAALVWQYDSHAFRGRAVLFEAASRLNHSCDPNTSYLSRWVEGGRALFVANRDIEAGSALLTSYLGHDDVLPAPLRQRQLLEGYGFTCDCPRCTQDPDLFGQLPCPRCYPGRRDSSGLLASGASDHGSMDEGTGTFTFHPHLLSHYLSCDMARVAAGHPRPWQCAACGTELEDTAGALFPWAGERRDLQLTALLLEMGSEDDTADSNDGNPGDQPLIPRLSVPESAPLGALGSQVWEELSAEVFGALGCKHAAAMLVTELQLEFLDLQFRAVHDDPAAAALAGCPSTAELIPELQRKWAMLWAWGDQLVRQPSFAHQRFAGFLAPIQTLIEERTERAAAGVAAGQMVRVLLRHFGLHHRPLDVQGIKSRALLQCWARLTALPEGGRPVVELWGGMSNAELGRLLRLSSGGMCLFDSEAEADSFCSWYSTARRLSGTAEARAECV